MKSLLIIWALVLITGIAGYSFINSSLAAATPGGANASSKYDGDCPTPPDYATTGRCADKCLTGQYLQGYDKETGAAICASDPQPECPYAATIQAGTPECDKLAPQNGVLQNANSVTPPATIAQDDTPPAPVEGFTGK